MNHLISIIKELEIELRSNEGKLESKELWTKLSELPEWDYRIIQDAMLRIRMFIQSGNDNFVHKLYEQPFKSYPDNITSQTDILIVQLKRDQADTSLTDSWNRLIVPAGLRSKTIEIWGYQVTAGRNFAVKEALKMGAKYLLFIDDDILAPNNALMKLYNLMIENDVLVTSALYYKKVEPLEAPFENEHGQIFIPEKDDKIASPFQVANSICGMGFCLLNLEQISNKVPMPLFWEFGAPDGFWSMGEDAFFTQNLVEYTGSAPLVDTSIKCMHMDKTWKKLYGERDNQVVYASGIWDSNDIDSFERMRVPPEYPLILICIPTRLENDPIAADLENLILLRGYRSELFRVWDKGVDEARNICAAEALKREADYLLFIDNDIIPTKDGLTKLLKDMEETKGPVVSGDYPMKGKPAHSASTHLDTNGLVTALDRTEDFKKGKLFKANWLIGLGFCLINTNVFRQMRQPWFKCYAQGKESQVNEDAHFTELCFENGYNVYINPKAECLHVDFQNRVIYGERKEDEQYAGFDDIMNSCSYFKEET